MHIKNIYADGELEEDSTCKEFLQVLMLVYDLFEIIKFTEEYPA